LDSPQGSGDNTYMSESLEMYLATIIRHRSSREEPLPLSMLANALSIASVSANEMCRKLQEQGLVIYRPYKGVTLTEEGERQGRAVLRRRGIWTVFLTQKLGIEPERAHEIADTLEHGIPDDVADRLADFLGNPRVTPLGMPIPSANTTYAYPVAIPLIAVTTGRIGHVAELPLEPTTRDFLHAHGLQVGTPVTVLSITDSGERLLALGAAETPERHLSIAQAVAGQIRVIPQEDLHEVAEVVCEPVRETPSPVKLLPLSQLHKEETGIIVRINSRGALRQRLLDMGIVTGEEIRLKHKAPFGNPLEFEIKGYQISLRKEEAAEIMVEVPFCT
ncbi:MAG: FeoA domain-containing protein, partial [Anaerolineae bacterium]|nr:FeoA domain-containing protein [Anaerolineae bacterium]